jgi:3-oxoacyl-(acyl-carrier-protein) synthase
MSVYITNLSFISRLGTSIEEWVENVEKGQSQPLPDALPLDSFLIEDFRPSLYLGAKGVSYKARSTLFSLAALQLLFDREDPFLPDLREGDIGICFASNAGSIQSIADYARSTMRGGFKATSPMQLAMIMPSITSANLAIRHNVSGFNTTISSGISAGLDILNYSSIFLREKRCRKVLAGGAEEITEITREFFQNVDCLRRSRVTPGEGAAILVLEEGEDASRFRNVFGELRGYGHAFNTEPKRNSAVKHAMSECMQAALEDAGLGPEEIDCICLNHNGYPRTDRAEAAALETLFPRKTKRTRFKNMIGECYGASGVFQVIGACLDGGKKEYDRLIGKHYLINCFDFESNYSSLVLKG